MRRINAVALSLLAIVTQLALAQVATRDAHSASFPAVDFDDFAMPRLRLIQMEPVQQVLQLSADQKQRQATIIEQFFKTVRASRRANGPQDFIAARNEAEQALLKELEPAQRKRFDGIELRLRGPTAFASPELPKRLGLSGRQTETVRRIAETADKELQRAARVPLPWNRGDSSVSEQAIRDFVASEKFSEAKKKARQEVFDGRTAALAKIEKELIPDQLTAYRALFGEPLDVDNFLQASLPKEREAQRDMQQVVRELGLGGGQQGDPNFDTKVPHPAYASDHPQVLFDEAHNNFHTTDGRYKVFVQLISSDGYRVTPNHEPFTPALLAKYQVLVIANAMAAGEGDGDSDAATSAFTPEYYPHVFTR